MRRYRTRMACHVYRPGACIVRCRRSCRRISSRNEEQEDADLLNERRSGGLCSFHADLSPFPAFIDEYETLLTTIGSGARTVQFVVVTPEARHAVGIFPAPCCAAPVIEWDRRRETALRRLRTEWILTSWWASTAIAIIVPVASRSLRQSTPSSTCVTC